LKKIKTTFLNSFYTLGKTLLKTQFSSAQGIVEQHNFHAELNYAELSNALPCSRLRNANRISKFDLLVRGETAACEFFILCTWTAVVGIRKDGDTSARSKKTCNLDIFRIHKAYKILHDYIDTVFMKIPVIPETEKIQFEALALYHPHIRNIAYPDFSKVWLSRDRAEAGKLRTVETDPIVIPLMFVDKSLKYFWSIIHTVLRLMSEGMKPLLISVAFLIVRKVIN